MVRVRVLQLQKKQRALRRMELALQRHGAAAAAAEEPAAAAPAGGRAAGGASVAKGELRRF